MNRELVQTSPYQQTSQPASQPAGRPASQPANQPTSQAAKQKQYNTTQHNTTQNQPNKQTSKQTNQQPTTQPNKPTNKHALHKTFSRETQISLSLSLSLSLGLSDFQRCCCSKSRCSSPRSSSRLRRENLRSGERFVWWKTMFLQKGTPGFHANGRKTGYEGKEELFFATPGPWKFRHQQRQNKKQVAKKEVCFLWRPVAALRFVRARTPPLDDGGGHAWRRPRGPGPPAGS